jgi:hypothetical protein
VQLSLPLWLSSSNPFNRVARVEWRSNEARCKAHSRQHSIMSDSPTIRETSSQQVLALPTLRFVIMSALSQQHRKIYTLTLLTPTSATPTFLCNLQRSNLSTSWIGELAGFYRKESPSTWEWSHILLTEGRGVVLPENCRTVQTWTFELDAEDVFRPDPEDKEPDEKCELQDKCVRFPKHIGRFCVLIFYTEEVKERYTQHWETVGQNNGLGKVLDMRVQLIGRILNTEEKLGRHGKTPVANLSTKRKKKWQKFEEVADFATNELSTTIASAAATETQRPSFKHFTLTSFPSSEEHEQYLASKERKDLEETVGVDGVNDGMILAQRFVMPPKSQPISKNDWAFGNPHGPRGQDWFG